MPEIQECHTVTGEADYLLKVVAPDLKSFSSFLMERLTKLFDITNTTSMVSLEELKQTTALPIRERRVERRSALESGVASAPVAQWIEHPPPKGRVARSIRVGGANPGITTRAMPGVPLATAFR